MNSIQTDVLTIVALVLAAVAIILGVLNHFGMLADIRDALYVKVAFGQPTPFGEKDVFLTKAEYDERIHLFATALYSPTAELPPMYLGFYSQSVGDLRPKYVQSSDPQFVEAYNEYARRYNAVGKFPGVKVSIQETLKLDLYDVLRTMRYTYAFLVAEETGEVIPLYPHWFGYHHTMVHYEGQPAFESVGEVPLGNYQFFLVSMPDKETTDLTEVGSLHGTRLALVEYPDPVNETLGFDPDGHAWAFTVEEDFMARLNPYVVGQTVYPKDQLADYDDELTRGEAAEVIEAKTFHIKVRFSDGREKTYDWSWFLPSPESGD